MESSCFIRGLTTDLLNPNLHSRIGYCLCYFICTIYVHHETYKLMDVFAGIGFNVGNEKPTTCLNTVLKELSTTPNEFRREDMMAAFFNKFEMLYDIFINQGEPIFWSSLQYPGM